MGVAETYWNGVGASHTVLPTTIEEYRRIYSGEELRRKGVAFIVKELQSQP
jgi:hypothetical protein